jgi:hypothetical protein
MHRRNFVLLGGDDTLFPMALRECRVTFRDVRDIQHSVVVHAETTMDAAALGLKRIQEQQFVMEDLADPVTVELVTSTQHKVSLKKVVEWMAHAGGKNPKETAMMLTILSGFAGHGRTRCEHCNPKVRSGRSGTTSGIGGL